MGESPRRFPSFATDHVGPRQFVTITPDNGWQYWVQCDRAVEYAEAFPGTRVYRYDIVEEIATRLFPAPVEAEMPELAYPFYILSPEGVALGSDGHLDAADTLRRQREYYPSCTVVRLAVVEVLPQEPEVVTGKSGWSYRKRGDVVEATGAVFEAWWPVAKTSEGPSWETFLRDSLASESIASLLRGALDDREGK